MIAAIAHNNVIGAANGLPWHLPADLRHFREMTWGKPIIMGRKTAESIAKALPGRDNIVISHASICQIPGMRTAKSLAEALTGLHQEAMIIGGASIYQEALPLATRLYLTRIDAEFAGDRYFPNINPDDWEETTNTAHAADEKNPYPYRFMTLRRIRV